MLGIFSANFPQVPLRPGINLRRRVPVTLAIGDIVTARATAVLGTLTVNTRTLTLQQV